MNKPIRETKSTVLDAELHCVDLCDSLMMIDEDERAAAIARVGVMFVEFCGYEISRLGPCSGAAGFFMAANQIEKTFSSIGAHQE
ncbi:MAG: hypothetical protein ACJAWC_003007 [Yoonia sp.]|jgi:hypothetical protein